MPVDKETAPLPSTGRQISDHLPLRKHVPCKQQHSASFQVIPCAVRSDVIKRMTLLTNLSRLVVTGLSCGVHLDKFPTLTSDFDWCNLQALQTLCILRCDVELGHGVASLLQLSHLKHVSFEGSTFEGSNGIECLAALCYRFASLRPDVELVLQTRHYKFRGVTLPVLCRFSNDFAESLPQTAK